MNWKTFASVFPVDTRQLLGILLPDLMVDAEQLGNQQATNNQQVMKVNGKPVYRPVPYRRKQTVEIQTASVGPGVYHLRIRIGDTTDYGPWMEPGALKLWLIIEHPTMFQLAGGL